jgi:hypothetical protein
MNFLYDYTVGMVANAVTKSTVLVNDTNFMVIIHDFDTKRELPPGAT